MAGSQSKLAQARPEREGAAQPTGGEDAIRGWTYAGLNYPTFKVTLLAKAIDRLTLRALSAHCDLTIAQWRVLSRLAPLDGATVGQIAQMAWVDRAETSRAATSLEARGLIARRENPGDRRAPILYATPAGTAEYQRLLPIRSEFHRRLTEDMSPQEREMLDLLLGRIARKLGHLVED